MSESFSNSPAQSSVELQDLGNGQWRGVYESHAILLEQSGKDISTTLGQLTMWAGYEGKAAPAHLAEVLENAIADGLIDTLEVVRLGRTGNIELPRKDWTLTRKAALLLMTRCKTPRAIELTRAMADVFELWLDRRHAVPTVRVDVLGLIGEYGEYSGSRIKAELRKLADLYSGGAKRCTREWKRSRGRLDSRLRRAVALGWGRRWSVLPRACWDIVMLNLDDMHQEACRDRKRLNAPIAKQTDFGFN